MANQTSPSGALQVPFNPKPPTCMHIDLNSCFATIEQQANPLLRGKPVAVAAYTTPSGCILAPSVEAKRLGVKVGMRVREGRLLCPQLTVIAPDPWKYRTIHMALKRLLSDYTESVIPKSIDEFMLNLEGYPAYRRGMQTVALEIKRRIKQEIGEWLTVSIGIAPNFFLAKTAAGLHKPDGLDQIDHTNYRSVYAGLELADLCGINVRNAARLNMAGIYTVTGMYEAPLWQLKAAFRSIVSYYWHLRLRGWEIDDVEFGRKSFGNSYALPKPFTHEDQLSPLIMKLVQKMSGRLRRHGHYCQGVHVSLLFRGGTHWHMGRKTKNVLIGTPEIYKEVFRVFKHCPYRQPVHTLAVSCFNLVPAKTLQLDLFQEKAHEAALAHAMDAVNERWGDYVITPARMLGTKAAVPDRVPFGGIKELEEFMLTS